VAPDKSLCIRERDPLACSESCLAALLERGANGDKHNRVCPVHGDRRASLSINPGSIHRIVWHCGAGCPAEDVRAELERLGAAPSCLGRYGLPKRTIQPGMRVIGHDPVLVADSKRLHAILKLPRDLNGKLYVMCVQAISEGDGDLAADPVLLLPVNADDFYALAKRAGIERRYRYELYKRWVRS
jgi:hypothetical protein